MSTTADLSESQVQHAKQDLKLTILPKPDHLLGETNSFL